MTPVFEILRIRDSGHNSGGRFAADAFELCDALTCFTGLEDCINALAKAGDSSVKLAQLVHEIGQHFAREWCERIAGVGNNGWNLPTRPRDRLSKHDATLGQDASHLADQASSIVHQATASTMQTLNILLFNRLHRNTSR